MNAIYRGLFIFSVLCFQSINANVIIPSLITFHGIFTAYSGFLIFLILLAKTLCFLYAIPNQEKRVILAVLTMNLASATVGLILKILFIDVAVGSILYYFSLDQVVQVISQSLTFGPLPGFDIFYGVLYFIGAVIINVFVEGFVAMLFFPNIERKKIVYTTIIANIVGVGIGLFGLSIYKYSHGGSLPE